MPHSYTEFIIQWIKNAGLVAVVESAFAAVGMALQDLRLKWLPYLPAAYTLRFLAHCPRPRL